MRKLRGGIVSSKFFGGTILLAILLGAIAIAAAPLVVGAVAGALLPGRIGELRDGTTGWALLHVLWMYPAIWVLSSVAEVVQAIAARGGRPGRISDVLATCFLWLCISVMYLVYFEHIWGAGIAAGVAMLIFWPFVKWLERTAPEDPEPAQLP